MLENCDKWGVLRDTKKRQVLRNPTFVLPDLWRRCGSAVFVQQSLSGNHTDCQSNHSRCSSFWDSPNRSCRASIFRSSNLSVKKPQSAEKPSHVSSMQWVSIRPKGGFAPTSSRFASPTPVCDEALIFGNIRFHACQKKGPNLSRSGPISVVETRCHIV
jgi:hypothetical protein